MKIHGVEIRDRETGLAYGLHDDCEQPFCDALAAAGAPDAFNPFTGRLVVIGPLLHGGLWVCTHCREAIKQEES